MLTIFNVIIYYYIYIYIMCGFFLPAQFLSKSYLITGLLFSFLCFQLQLKSFLLQLPPPLSQHGPNGQHLAHLQKRFSIVPHSHWSSLFQFQQKSFLSCLLSLGLLLFAAAFSGGGSEQILGFGCISSSTSSCPDTMDRPKVCFLGKWVHVLASLLLSYMLFYCSDLFYFYGVF